MFLDLDYGTIINLDQVLFIYSNNKVNEDCWSAIVFYKDGSNNFISRIMRNIDSFIDVLDSQLPFSFVKTNNNYIVNIEAINQIEFDYSEKEYTGELIDHSISIDFSHKFSHIFFEDSNRITDISYQFNNSLCIDFDTYKQGVEILNKLSKACNSFKEVNRYGL